MSDFPGSKIFATSMGDGTGVTGATGSQGLSLSVSGDKLTGFLGLTQSFSSVGATNIQAAVMDYTSNLSPAPTWLEGRVFYDPAEHSLAYYNDQIGVTVNIGQETMFRARNTSGATLANGKLVYITGANGDRPTINLAQANGMTTARVVGMLTHDIPNNQEGYVTQIGVVHGLNTNGFTEGAPIFLSESSAGDYTETPPVAPNYRMQVGWVSRKNASDGAVMVSIDRQAYIQQLTGDVVADGRGDGAVSVSLSPSLISSKNLSYNGLEAPSLFAIGYNGASRMFSVGTTTASAYTVGGVRYFPGATTTVTASHGATNGMWYLYYDASGGMTFGQTAWDILTTAQIMSVYYIGASSTLSIPFDERHPGAGGDGFPNAVHKYEHLTSGTRLVSGCSMSGYALNTSGTGAIQYTVSTGTIVDEDIYLSTAAVTPASAVKRVWYKSGPAATPAWLYTDDADGFTDNGTDIYYNQNNGGTWQRTALGSNNTWVNYWMIATTSLNAPQIWVITGQTTFGTLALAQASTFATEISDFNLLTAEGVVLYRITYRRGSTFGAPGNAQIADVARINSPIISSSAGAISAQTVGTDITSFTDSLSATDTTVQAALNTLNGVRQFRVVSLAGATTLPYTVDSVLASAASTTFTITLPTAVGWTGKRYLIKKTDNTGGGDITVTTTSAQTIDGFTSVVLQNQYDILSIFSDGGNWNRERV